MIFWRAIRGSTASDSGAAEKNNLVVGTPTVSSTNNHLSYFEGHLCVAVQHSCMLGSALERALVESPAGGEKAWVVPTMPSAVF